MFTIFYSAIINFDKNTFDSFTEIQQEQARLIFKYYVLGSVASIFFIVGFVSLDYLK